MNIFLLNRVNDHQGETSLTQSNDTKVALLTESWMQPTVTRGLTPMKYLSEKKTESAQWAGFQTPEPLSPAWDQLTSLQPKKGRDDQAVCLTKETGQVHRFSLLILGKNLGPQGRMLSNSRKIHTRAGRGRQLGTMDGGSRQGQKCWRLGLICHQAGEGSMVLALPCSVSRSWKPGS